MSGKTGQTDFQTRTEHGPDERKRRRLVRRSHFMTLVGAWIVTVPISAAFSAVLFGVFSLIFL